MIVMDRFLYLVYWLVKIYLIGVIAWLLLIVPADAKHWTSEQPYNVQVEDIYEWRYTSDRHSVEKCKTIYEENLSNSENALKGALIGGIIGNIISDGDETATAGGALFGALAGANTDPIHGVKKKVCKVEKKRIQVYSHSLITFWLSGDKYELRLYK